MTLVMNRYGELLLELELLAEIDHADIFESPHHLGERKPVDDRFEARLLKNKLRRLKRAATGRARKQMRHDLIVHALS